MEDASITDVELAMAARHVEAALFGVAGSFRIGRYVVLERIGAGAMGVVHAAYDPELDRKVAIKILVPRAGDPVVGRERMIREARALGRLAHPSVVAVHDVGTIGTGERPPMFIAMELVDGMTLTRWLRERPAPRVVLDALLQVGDGLAAAHSVGLVHRDVKPDNVMISAGKHGSPRARVMDFGLARDHAANVASTSGSPDPAMSVATREGTVLGTPAYMPPEQLTGRTADEKSDQFSFCVLAWEAFAGVRPFAGRTASELALAIEERRIVGGPTGDFGRSLRRPLLRGLSTRPEDRFADLDALLAALRHASRRTRVLRIGAASVAITGGVIAAVVLQRAAAERACERAGAEIERVWNEPRAVLLESAFAASSVPYAADGWARMRPHLDARADAWAQTRSEVCRSGGGNDVDADDPRRVCLDDARRRLDATLARIAAADLPVLLRGTGAIDELDDPARCADEAGAVELPPADRMPELDDLRERVAALHANALFSSDAETAEEANSLVARAQELGWPPLVQQTHYVAGEAIRKRDAAAARVHFETALALAARHGEDRRFLDALLQLAEAARERGELEGARALGMVAFAFLARIEPEPRLYTAQVETFLGRVETMAESFDAALLHFDRAQALANAEGVPPTHPLRLTVLNNVATLHLRRGDPHAARDVLQRQLALTEEVFGTEHPSVARVLGNLAAAEGGIGEHESVRAAYARAAAIIERTYGADAGELINPLTNLAFMTNDAGDTEEALELFARVYAIAVRARGPQSPEVARISAARALAALDRGMLDEALGWARESLAIRERLFGAEHTDTAVSQMMLARALVERDALDEARTGFEAALAIYERRVPQTRDHAVALEGLALIASESGDVEQAESLERQVFAMLDAVGLTPEERPSVWLHFARFARERGAFDEAQSWLSKIEASLSAHDAAERWDYQWERGRLAAARARRPEAQQILGDALAVAARFFGDESIWCARIAIDLAEVEHAMGERADARTRARDALTVLERRRARAKDQARARALVGG